MRELVSRSWTSFLWHALLLLLPQAGEAWSGRLVPSMQASNQQRPRPQEGKPVTRRHFQSGLLASVMAGALMGGPGARAEEDGAAVVEALPPPEVAPLPKSRLLERINDPEIKNPGLAGFGSPTMVYLPSWLFGTWNVTMRYERSSLPLGEEYVPERMLRSLSSLPREPVSFPLRFYSTLPDSPENTLRVSLGQMPIPQVVPDRAYNTRSVIDAYYGYPAVSEVLYPLDNNPLRLRVEFATVGPDLRPLPSRRQELFINNIMFEEAQPGRQYVCSEFIRSVTLGRSVSVSDSETLSLYELQPDGRVKGRQRVAIFLTPNPNSKEGAQYFETGGRSVLLMDYDFDMVPVVEPGGGSRCVVTPKGVQQCVGGEGPAYAYPSGRGEGEQGAEGGAA